MELDSSLSLSTIPVQWRTGTLVQPLDLWGISHADGQIDVSRQAPRLCKPKPDPFSNHPFDIYVVIALRVRCLQIREGLVEDTCGHVPFLIQNQYPRRARSPVAMI